MIQIIPVNDAICPEHAKNSVVALGNFDGMHKGHQHVILSAKKIALATGASLAALTFEPHPISVFSPSHPPFRLTSLEQKASLMASLGVQFLYVVPFNLSFSRMSAETFITDILVKQLNACHVVAGYDFIFGYQRLGNAALLEACAKQYPFGFTQTEAISDPKTPDIAYSSTQVRQLIAQGKVSQVPPILGRYFSIAGQVCEGNKKGRTLGFPTANLALGESIRPRFGVYATLVHLDGRTYPAVANIGCKPTLGIHEPQLEVHLFDFDQSIYNRYIEVELRAFIREEMRFHSLTELQKHITQDCLQARALLGIT